MNRDDTIIRGALILDGSGRPGRVGDVLLRRGRIALVGGRVEVSGARVVEADGLALAPGFIDMHSHSDLAVLTDPLHLAKVAQGVTTEVVGQDGLSYAPATEASVAVLRDQLAGWNGVPDSLEFGWASIADYLDDIDRHGVAVNVAALIPQATVRMNVLGSEDRTATSSELTAMRAQVDRGMRDGAFGMSSGLTYVPGTFTDSKELIELCRVVAGYGGYYAPHHRSYGAGALGAYSEMIDVARQSGCPLHLTHATMNFTINRGRAGELLALIDEALADGVDITLDTYPYLAGSTTLAALLPSWAASGGPDGTLARLRDPEQRARIAEALDLTGSDGCHGVTVEWQTIQVAGVRDPRLADRVGRTIAEIAAAEGRQSSESAMMLMVADGLGTSILQHVGDEENVRAIMRHPRHTGGSDGLLVGGKPHPRGWGTFPRYLAHYVRDEGVLTLEDAIVHLAARPAARLGLKDRGRVARGLVADLVLFDPDTVLDRATYDNPRVSPAGIPWVFVAGEPVIANGVRTSSRPGVALRRDAQRRMAARDTEDTGQ